MQLPSRLATLTLFGVRSYTCAIAARHILAPDGSMNTRHSELKSNELAHWLDDHLSQIKPYVPAILVGGGLVVVLLLAWTFYAGQKNARMAAAWGGVISGLGNESELEQVVEKYPGTSAAAWASYAQGIGDLMQGSNLLFTDREDSEKRLNQAAKKFQSAIDGAGNDQLLISR